MIHMIRVVSPGNEGQRNDLRKICAWCNGTLREGVEPTSHGICADCAEKEMTSFLEAGSFMKEENPPSQWSPANRCRGKGVGGGIFQREIRIGKQQEKAHTRKTRKKEEGGKKK